MLVRVRPERPDDYDAIDEIVLAAFGRQFEVEFVRQVRASDRYIADLALVAQVEGAIVGQAMFSWILLDGPEQVPVLTLAPVSVHPDSQGKGVGSALVRAGMARADSTGAPLVIVLGHPEWYPRFGCEPARPHGIEPPWPELPDPVFMVKRLSSYDERCRGEVVYPPAFGGV